MEDLEAAVRQLQVRDQSTDSEFVSVNNFDGDLRGPGPGSKRSRSSEVPL